MQAIRNTLYVLAISALLLAMVVVGIAAHVTRDVRWGCGGADIGLQCVSVKRIHIAPDGCGVTVHWVFEGGIAKRAHYGWGGGE
jgi:hypothetical protein